MQIRPSRYRRFLFLLDLWLIFSTLAVAQNRAEALQETTAIKPAETKTLVPQESVPGRSPRATPENPGAVQANSERPPDYSREGIIIERLITKVVFESDGTGTRETSVAFRVQSQAGVQSLAVLTFPYLSSNENVEFDYIRVRKPDGPWSLPRDTTCRTCLRR
jgi:Domain of Unknown Function with PDB structure (DUF3857)